MTLRVVATELASFAGIVRADDARERDRLEHTVIVGVGGAGELELGGGAVHGGANVMIEWEAVESWLEIELGASILAIPSGHELPVDVLFKKPFRVSDRFETMIGVGPEVVRVSDGATTATRFGGEVAFDLMFWPRHRVGVWVEPSYDVVFHDGASHSLGITLGVMAGW